MTYNCSYGTECHYSHEPLKKAYRCYQCGEELNTRSDILKVVIRNRSVTSVLKHLRQKKAWRRTGERVIVIINPV